MTFREAGEDSYCGVPGYDTVKSGRLVHTITTYETSSLSQMEKGVSEQSVHDVP